MGQTGLGGYLLGMFLGGDLLFLTLGAGSEGALPIEQQNNKVNKSQLLIILIVNIILVIKMMRVQHHLLKVIGCFSNGKDKLVHLHQHKYFKLINNLKDQTYVTALVQQQSRLKDISLGKYASFSHLRNQINNLLNLSRLIQWGRAYHPQIEIPKTAQSITLVQKLIDKAFSREVNQSYNQQQQSSSTNQAISFSLYYQLCRSISPGVSDIYLNSYIYLMRQMWPVELIKSQQAIKEHNLSQTEKLILSKSKAYLQQMVKIICSQGFLQQVLSDTQMFLFINDYKGIIDQIDQKQMSAVQQTVEKYIWSDSEQQTLLHLQNMIYCLYLGVTHFQMKQAIVEWVQSRFNQGNMNTTPMFLTSLHSHQDKLTCLKFDFWTILSTINTVNNHNIKTISQGILSQLSLVNFETWKFRYAVWMFDSVSSATAINSQIITNLHKSITALTLQPHHPLSSFITSFINYTTEKNLSHHILNLQIQTSKWLATQSDKSLLAHSPEVLCQILPHADSHPALHKIYLPYLQRLLQVSLGQFQWSVLTQLFYFGLRWKADTSDEGYWKMQYVRRYILNEYAEMGIRRRQIPQQSYFYKIHELTTPDKFYKNYIDR